MRFADDMVVYTVPRRRVIDYGYSVDDASLARVENAARNISNQTIDEADHLRAISRRNDLIAIDRANRLMEAAQQPLPTANLRAHYHPRAADLHALEMAQHARRSMSMSDLREPTPRTVMVPTYPHYYPHYYHYYPEARYLPSVSHAPTHYPRDHYVAGRVARPVPVPAPISDYRKRLEKYPIDIKKRRLDTELLNFEFPTAESFLPLKDHLRGVNDKLLAHRLLLDRYAGIEMAHPDSVEHSVESKCSEILARMPNRTYRRDSDNDIRKNVPVVSAHQVSPCEAPISQIRHRIKKLVDRSKNRPHHY